MATEAIPLSQLAANLGAQAKLREDLEKARNELLARQETSRVEQTTLEARIKELELAQGEAEHNVNRMNEAMAEEASHWEGIGQRRNELEAILAEDKQTEAALRRDLEAAQKASQEQQKRSRADHSKHEATIKELETNEVSLEQKHKALSEALAAETRRREEAEKEAADAVFTLLDKEDKAREASAGGVANLVDVVGKGRAAAATLLASPWKFQQYGQSGLWVSDLFPEVARHVLAKRSRFLTEQARAVTDAGPPGDEQLRPADVTKPTRVALPTMQDLFS